MAAQQPSPSEIARDVLVLLAKRRLQPSPENFAALYYEVAKEPNVLQGFETLLKKIASRLPVQGGEQTRSIKQMQVALGEPNLEEAEKAFHRGWRNRSYEGLDKSGLRKFNLGRHILRQKRRGHGQGRNRRPGRAN